MLKIKHLEIHVAHACNLACDNCTHYSDQGHKGIVTLEQADEWMGAWSGRIQPGIFSLVGGEPTIHPKLTDFARLARRHWPDALLRIVTNGFFLHKHPELPEFMASDPKVRLYLSIHSNSPEYVAKLQPIFALIRDWKSRYGVQTYIYESFKDWRKQYRGSGATMEPFEDGNPRASWENCLSKDCPQLFEGKIWKCAPLAYLRMQGKKHSLHEKWRPYLQYEPLTTAHESSDLRRFFHKKEESYCMMCSQNPQYYRPEKAQINLKLSNAIIRVRLGSYE